MKKIVFTLLLGFMVTGCQAQNDRTKTIDDLVEKKTDSLGVDEPKISWKVDKKYDEKGNVIGYDSIYSYSYNNLGNLAKGMNLDSIMNSMKFFSYDNFSSYREDQYLGRIFNEDSLLNVNPFFDDFFEKQRANNFSDMRQLFQQMDSLQNMMMEKHRNFMPDETKSKSKI
ncbi:hypothetical protein DHD32_17835 [Arenibacter sp. TNZ]|jgi:hypothetical protein|uniref:membrane lipoprotein lipid attachment site-containing protein n=1 Tax=Arenibacter TaxID=178469 RepID=UPI000CD40079|nr:MULTISPECIES: membrane lipoprotein lipid attachment site-containing protein [Arenibacter]MCM4173340.1 hypothetical protein [Arenibacter sp. TNZ]